MKVWPAGFLCHRETQTQLVSPIGTRSMCNTAAVPTFLCHRETQTLLEVHLTTLCPDEGVVDERGFLCHRATQTLLEVHLTTTCLQEGEG